MNLHRIISTVAVLLLPATLLAQTTETLDAEFGARIAVNIDKKLSRGLHLSIEEELRMDQNLSAFDRFHTTVAVTYKVHPNVKLGAGYAMINPYSSSDGAFKSSRHRLMLDATGSLRFGDWRLSLKERLQCTFRTGSFNAYQTSQPRVGLKSRIKVQYKGWRRWEPYAYVEMRNVLNAPVIKAVYDGTYYYTASGSQYGDAGWFIDSHTGLYTNRLRGSLGVDYRVSKASSITLYLMADYVMDKEIDANSEGTKLKSYTLQRGFIGWLGATYTYSF